MGQVNYKKIFAMRQKDEEKIKKLCPDAIHKAGIYCFYRISEEGFKSAYVGLATKSLLSRMAQHLSGYNQHIDLSIRKYGLYDKDKNPFGYRCKVVCFCNSEEECNEKEQYYIKKVADAGWQLKNVTGGSQGKGKFGISENKPSKGYYDGKKQGRKDLAKEIRNLVEKYLVISTKKDSKLALNAMDKFFKLINEQDEESLS